MGANEQRHENRAPLNPPHRKADFKDLNFLSGSSASLLFGSLASILSGSSLPPLWLLWPHFCLAPLWLLGLTFVWLLSASSLAPWHHFCLAPLWLLGLTSVWLLFGSLASLLSGSSLAP